jgi:hypothetical protein
MNAGLDRLEEKARHLHVHIDLVRERIEPAGRPPAAP